MGVPGLWDFLSEAGKETCLLRMAHDRFESSLTSPEAFGKDRDQIRIGIDASIWLFHVRNIPGGGLNPHLRTLFFKLAKLLALPVKPLFVFDGPSRVSTKCCDHIEALEINTRLSLNISEARSSSEAHSQILTHFKSFWMHSDFHTSLCAIHISSTYYVSDTRKAPGEAEAELAYLNSKDILDIVLTDDVDALIFGAKKVMRKQVFNS